MLTQCCVTPERCESFGESDESPANLYLLDANRRWLFSWFHSCEFFKQESHLEIGRPYALIACIMDITRDITQSDMFKCEFARGANKKRFREQLATDTSFDRNRATIHHGCPTISITSETAQSIPCVTTIVFPRDYCHVMSVCANNTRRILTIHFIAACMLHCNTIVSQSWASLSHWINK